MTIGIYKLSFPNTDKVYIGQSLNIEVRFKQHIKLMSRQESSTKLNKAFLEYGPPSLEILSECSKENLDTYENETIDIYNSVVAGFNTCITAGGKTSLCGEKHPNAEYSNESILTVFELLITRIDLNFTEISDLSEVSKSVIAGISCLQQHLWLKMLYPNKYSLLEDIYNSGTRLNTKRGIKVNSYTLYSPIGESFLVDNTREFAKLHNLDYRHLSKLKNGDRKSHKGWTKVPALL